MADIYSQPQKNRPPKKIDFKMIISSWVFKFWKQIRYHLKTEIMKFYLIKFFLKNFQEISKNFCLFKKHTFFSTSRLIHFWCSNFENFFISEKFDKNRLYFQKEKLKINQYWQRYECSKFNYILTCLILSIKWSYPYIILIFSLWPKVVKLWTFISLSILIYFQLFFLEI